jgi:hypothetical protein
MLRRLIILAFLIAAVASEAPAQSVAQPPKGAAPPPKAVDAPPAMTVPQGFKFEGTGRRDPFVNPVPKPVKPEPEVPVVRPPGSKGVLLSEAQIAGIVWSKDPEMTRVVISAPGGRTFFVKKGDQLFDAVLKDIQRDGVVFEQRSKDKDGKTVSRDVVRKVR